MFINSNIKSIGSILSLFTYNLTYVTLLQKQRKFYNKVILDDNLMFPPISVMEIADSCNINFKTLQLAEASACGHEAAY